MGISIKSPSANTINLEDISTVCVRSNSSSFTPTDITGLRLWLKCNSGVSKTGTLVDSWADQSGNGNNATSSGTLRPAQAGAVTLNGYPAVVWDGSSDSMSIANMQLTGYQTWFGVVRQYDNPLFIEHSATSNDNPGHYIYGDSPYSVQVRRGTTTQYLDKASWLGSAAAYFFVRWNGSAIELWVNGVQKTGGTLSGSDPGNGTVTDTLFIGSRNGASFFSYMAVYELGVYNGYLNDTQKGQLETYLAGKYGL